MFNLSTKGILFFLIIGVGLSATNEFKSPTNIPKDWPSKFLELYRTDSIDSSLCQVVHERLGSSKVSWMDWQGTLDDCLKECTYDSNCKAMLYSAPLQTCEKLSHPELTDNPEWAKEWEQDEWIAFVRKDFLLPYKQQKCALYLQKSCSEDSDCKWGFGRMGYNQRGHLKFNRGFCGRWRCQLLEEEDNNNNNSFRKKKKKKKKKK